MVSSKGLSSQKCHLQKSTDILQLTNIIPQRNKTTTCTQSYNRGKRTFITETNSFDPYYCSRYDLCQAKPEQSNLQSDMRSRKRVQHWEHSSTIQRGTKTSRNSKLKYVYIPCDKDYLNSYETSFCCPLQSM